jgi:parallel beta-helix repeat protein
MKIHVTHNSFVFYTVVSMAFLLFLPGFKKAFSQDTIEVGGTLTQNANWTAENIYIVTDNILVFEGITLTIEAGTTVKFDQGRGLNIEGGSLRINGTAADSVKMVLNQNTNGNLNWQGLTINSVTRPGEVEIKYAIIKGAVIGIKGQSSRHVQVKNSKITNSFFIGINLVNSSYWKIENNLLEHNFVGVEIHASGFGNQSTGNFMYRNIFSNFVSNISIQSSSLGACFNNTIENNIIKEATQGIWLFSSSQGVAANTQIKRNLIYKNGIENDGFGIFASMDSVSIYENIFWRNKTAVVFNSSSDSYFHNNNIYENENGLFFRNNTSQLRIGNNTFTGNTEDILRFLANEDVVFSGNNIFRNVRDSATVKNLTPFDVNISDNYWGTTTDSIIQQLLYDVNDDPSLGELVFQPILNNENTAAPISAPYRFYRQVVGNKNRFTWESNPESNLEGYRIFHGEFQLYSFSDSTSLITDTIFEMPIQGSEEYAIAAYSQLPINSGKNQFKGFKSPYAFARQIPYAGEDTILCNTIEFFDLHGVTIPPDFTDLIWTTGGDGSFNDPSQPDPRYFPGKDDIETGQVRLTVSILLQDEIFQDEISLHFTPEPYVFAGFDTYLAAGNGFLAEDAVADNYSTILWQTNGDGSFDDPLNLIALYTPGPTDIATGRVTLTLHGISEWCPAASDSLTLFINQAYSLNGRAWKGNLPLPGNPILAIIQNDEENPLPQSYISITDDTGNFEFAELIKGKYILYLPADTLENSGFISGYYVGQSRWQNAFVIDIKGNTFDIDIRQMKIETQLPAGVGSISGRFAKPGDLPPGLQTFCIPWFRSSTLEFCDEGLSNVSILLFSLSKQRIYAHALTDEQGYFHFNNLPFGSYIIEAELAGFRSESSAVIQISSESSSMSGIEAFIGFDDIIDIFVPETLPGEAKWFVYPNPANHVLNIRSENFNDKTHVDYSIYDLFGRKLSAGSEQSFNEIISIDVRFLKSDMYILKIESTEENKSFIFRKN